MHVSIAETPPGADWDAFVAAHPEGTPFHLSAWSKSVRDAMGHKTYHLICRATETGPITGVLPLTRVKSLLFGHTLISCAFAVYGGPLAKDDTSLQALVTKAQELLKETGASALEFRSQTRSCPDWAAKEGMYVTFKRAIDADPEVNLKAIPRKQRAMVRKGIKAELKGVVDTSIDRHFAMYSLSVRNLGTPVFPRKWFTALQSNFGKDCDILTIEADGNPVASVMSLYFKDEVLPYYGGGGIDARKYAANDYMYWALMEHAREKGLTSFDFGRSKVGTGAFSFKKNWGFEPTPLSYEFYMAQGAEMPDINPLNPKYQLMIKTWRKLPLGLANTMGPFISRNLG